MTRASLWLSASLAAIALVGAPGEALERCKVKVDPKDGTILVGATGVTGALRWGETASNCNRDLHDSACVAGGTAKGCTLDAPGTLAARTAPFDCTLDLRDDAGQLECYVKGCTVRPQPPTCGNGEVLSWDGQAFACVPDDAGPGGTVTAVYAGPGLAGGPVTTAGALQVNAPICPATFKLAWSGSSFQCAADQDTQYAPGNQLFLSGTTFSVLEGVGSGLDADLLDGMSSASFAPAGHGHALTCYDASASAVGSFHSVTCSPGSVATGGGGYCNGTMGKIAVHGSYPSGSEGWTVSCLTEATVTVVVRCCAVQ